MTSFLDQPIPSELIDACERGTGYYKACANGIAAARIAKCWCDLEPKYLTWAAAYAPGLTYAERCALCDASDDPKFWRGKAAERAPGLTYAERCALCDASDDPKFWRGRVAAYTPDLTYAERCALCDESNDPKYWRGKAAARASGLTDEQRAELRAWWVGGGDGMTAFLDRPIPAKFIDACERRGGRGLVRADIDARTILAVGLEQRRHA